MKYCKALVNLAVAALLLLCVVFILPRAIVFLSPFVVGWIIALLAGPPVRFFEEKIKLKRKIGSAFVIIVVIAAVVLMLYFVGTLLFEQLAGLITSLPEMLEEVEADLTDIGVRLNVLLEKLPGDFQLNFNNDALQIESYLGDFLEKVGSPTITAAGNLAKQLPTVFIAVIMSLLSAYFFVAERNQVNEWFRKHMPDSVQMRYQMVRHSLKKSVGGYLKAQLKIEILDVSAVVGRPGFCM